MYRYIHTEPPSKSMVYGWYKKCKLSVLRGGPIALQRFVQITFTSSFRFKPFISLPPFFRFNSSFLFVLLFLSFQLVHFIASVLSLQLFPSIRYFLPFVSTLCNPVRYFFPFLSTLPFRSLRHAFRFNSFLPSITPRHCFNASILFI